MREVIPVPPVQSVPLTQPWFLGVANIRGNLYNITDLAQFLGMPPTAKSSNTRILLLNSETTTQAALVIGSLVGLRSIDTMKAKDSSTEEVFFNKQTYEDAENNEWLEVDIDMLVKDKDFIQPTIS